MKAIWSGYITLGQLGIPVRLYSATKAVRPEFTQLHEKDGSPVERFLRCRAEGKEISPGETIRAIKSEGRFVTFTPDELTRAEIERSKSLAVKQFCRPEDIDAIYYEKPYYIVPASGGGRAYTLLREALSRSSRAAVTQFVIYNKDRIGIISPRRDILVLYQLRFATEIIPRSDIKMPPLSKPSPAETDTLISIIDRFSGPFYVEDYHDEQTERIDELLAQKLKGLPAPRRSRDNPSATKDNDLLPALQRTLKEARPEPEAVKA